MIILNKDAAADLKVELDFGRGVRGAVETEILHAPALDRREAHITTSAKTDSLKQGQVFRHYFRCNRITSDADLRRWHIPFICWPA